jgi:L-aminopeptidase/D-esterase-like protein
MTGRKNAITDVPGVLVGHETDEAAASGVTVILCPQGAVAGVDVRGGAPGTRETDLLEPTNLVERVQAVALCGGSVFGLAAVEGVVRWLEGRGEGFPLEGGHVAPIVPAAVLFDLGRGREFRPPVDAAWGRRACDAASAGPVVMGCVGAGTGAVAGGIKGGVGTASEVLPWGVTVGALAAVNALGLVVDPVRGRPWEIRLELGREFGALGRRRVRLPREAPSGPVRNTTVGVVATDARLTKAQAQKVAQMAHDGLARAVRPSHTLFDGDTIFSLATGGRELPETAGFFAAPQAAAMNEVGRAAADCFTRAVIHAVLAARSAYGFTAFRDLPEMQA